MSIKNKFHSVLADLPPAYFAMVMATGIVSIASHLLGFPILASSLLWLNILFYILLWIFTLLRLLFFPQNFFHDLQDHLRGVGFFTMVAGTCVLGSQCVILFQGYSWGTLLLVIGAVLWVILIYAVFSSLIIKGDKPSLEEGISGVWLVAVVATQSVSVLTNRIAPYFSPDREILLFLSLCLFLFGGLLYTLIISLIFYRLLFFPLKPEKMAPPYWINMGAVAISTLAGATLLTSGKEVQFLIQLRPFTMGMTLFFWSTATWWIPLLLLLYGWRHLRGEVRFSYDPQYWSLVFPLGMYTTCTFQLANAANLDFLMFIPRYFIFAALLAWILTFAGLVRRIIQFIFFNPLPTANE
jgi:tellurite resistance protein TehA-like permease